MHYSIAVRKRLAQVARTIPVQHRRIRELLADLLASSRSGDSRQTRANIELLGSALEAHFELEEQRLFPLLSDVHPELTERLNALCQEHGRMLRDLTRISKRPTGEATQGFAKFLADHEKREEDLVRRAQS